MHEIRNVLYFLMLIHRFVSALIYTPKLTYKYKYSFLQSMKILYQFHFIKLVRQGVREMKRLALSKPFHDFELFYVFSHLGEVFFHFYGIFTLDNIEERR